VARAAEARYAELTRDAIPGSNPSWGLNRLRDELHAKGFIFEQTTRSPGWLYSNPTTGEQVRLMEQPQFRHRTDPPEKFYFDHYYRFRYRDDQIWGSPIPIPRKPTQ
jgi:hypothetical protein